ncbi:hypothetical protein E4T56_gene2669 [Termitomyces sp. T112]|nr:hypothetical protein E4T56_gene2669 [Termitomyces sp. T112]
MSTTPHPLISLDSKLGAGFIGNIVAGIFYGVTCIQSYTYFRSSDQDKQWFRLVIFILWILDTFHLTLITHTLYYYMISNFGNYLALVFPTWSLIAQTYVTSISDLIIRCIFGRRVWLMTDRSYPIAICIASMSLLTFVSAFVFASLEIEGKTFTYISKISYLLYMSLGSGVAADMFIAISLCANLWKRRSGFEKSDTLIRTLILYAINTSLLTTLCSLACLITYAVWPNDFTFMAIYFVLSKLFLNSLLATLNTREALSEKISGFSRISVSGNTPTTDSSTRILKNNPVVVSINQEVVKDYELGHALPQKSLPSATNNYLYVY